MQIKFILYLWQRCLCFDETFDEKQVRQRYKQTIKSKHLNMAAQITYESDISFASAESESSESENEEFVDAVESGDWQDAPLNVEFSEFDASQSGPKHNLDNKEYVFDFFSLFWTTQLFNLIVQETDRYARTVGNAGNDWQEVNLAEMKAFFAIFIVMGIKRLPSMDLYWSSSQMVGCHWISQTISRDRFQAIIVICTLLTMNWLYQRTIQTTTHCLKCNLCLTT